MADVNEVNEEQLGFMTDMLNEGPVETPPAETPVETPPVETPTETSVETPVVTPETHPAEEVDDTYESLRQEILALTAQLNNPVQQVYPQETPASVEQQIAQPQTQQPPVTQTEQFIPGTYLTEDELDAVIDNPNLIVTAIQRAQKDILDYVSKQAPNQNQMIQQMVSQAVQAQIFVTKAITEFYDENSDLRPYADYVRLVLAENERKAIGTQKTYAEIFKETAQAVRTKLRLPDPTAGTVDQKGQRTANSRPGFAGSKKGGNARQVQEKGWFDPNAASMLK